MAATLKLMVLISITGCVELITVRTPQKLVNVTTGGTVHLQCSFTTSQDTNALTVQWNFVAKASLSLQQIYYYQSGQAVITKPYEGRLHPPVSPNVTKNVSISISNMQPSDAGVYTCEVHNFPDVDGQSDANIIVNVLEKPSTPFCAVHGDVESGHLVTLTCHSERGSPTPTYTWIRLDQTRTRRPTLGRATPTGLLEFRNISQFEFGEYQCNASNVVGSSICTLELNNDVGDGVIAGAIIGALLGCVLIILIVWFIAHRVKKQKYSAVKAPEASEMRGSSHQPTVTSEGVSMANTTPSHTHPDGEGAHA